MINSTAVAKFTLLAFIALMLGSCAIPEMPGELEWDLHASIPISARTYLVSDLIDSADVIRNRGWGIGMDGDSILQFLARQSLESTLKDSLRFNSYSRTVRRDITAIFLPINDSVTTQLGLNDLNSNVAGLHGQTIPTLAPHSLNSELLLSFADGVEKFRVDTGHVLITVENTLNYGVSNLSIIATNFQNEEYVYVSNAALGPSEVNEFFVSMHDEWHSALSQLAIAATGIGGIDILVDSTLGLRITTRLTVLQTEPYFGIVYPQHLQSDTLFLLDDQRHRLFYGVIDSAMLNLTFINESQLDDSIWLVFPDVLSPDGDTLRSVQFVPAYDRRSQSLHLHDHVMRLADTDPQLFRTILRSQSVQSAQSDSFVAGVEYVAGTLDVSNLIFSYFDGILENLEVEIDPEGQNVDRPPDGWEGVHPVEVYMKLNIASQVEVSSDLNFTIATYYQHYLIAQELVVLPAVQLGHDTLHIVGNLDALLAEYPDSIAFWGTSYSFGPAATNQTDTISITAELIAPVVVTLDTIDHHGDVEEVDTDDLENIQAARAKVKVWNRLPLGGSLTVLASSDSTSLASEVSHDVDTVAHILLSSPQVDDGRVTGESYSEFDISLDSPVIELLQDPPFFVRLDMLLPGSDGDTLIAHASDYISVQIIVEVDYRIRTGDY